MTGKGGVMTLEERTPRRSGTNAEEEEEEEEEVNTVFRKRDSHLTSYYSGSSKSKIDFVFVKDRDRRLVTDAKVVPYEKVAPQHRPLICTLKIAPPRQKQV
ncbi:unnamed protein product [Heligmosomoides polygyrus]|uniref:IPPc domain-containing protein n=1 Tax=Heligmosomoides polygyrus TaxID=6339 RepID=A0A183GAR0_HELPZ|nr:unnamed protein product [Heligmosomoides polygyrus]